MLADKDITQVIKIQWNPIGKSRNYRQALSISHIDQACSLIRKLVCVDGKPCDVYGTKSSMFPRKLLLRCILLGLRGTNNSLFLCKLFWQFLAEVVWDLILLLPMCCCSQLPFSCYAEKGFLCYVLYISKECYRDWRMFGYSNCIY